MWSRRLCTRMPELAPCISAGSMRRCKSPWGPLTCASQSPSRIHASDTSQRTGGRASAEQVDEPLRMPEQLLCASPVWMRR